MNCVSTRGAGPVTLREALALGLAPDGGLFVPVATPTVGRPSGEGLIDAAEAVLAPYFEGEGLDLSGVLRRAFTFDAPSRWYRSDTGLLELFHGPTAAFKDFGARFLAETLAVLPRAQLTTVLVATSGDTGAAVASAFHGRLGFRVVILYPDGLVSPRQAHQLGAFGDNVRTFRVAGTFDDCQRVVKAALVEPSFAELGLASANSVSLGRLLPQIAYYAAAAWQAQREGRGLLNVVVPSGNLGNGLACLLAKQQGAPVGRVVLASNANRPLTDLVATGRYMPRPSQATLANAMDVGAPSNVERLLYWFEKLSGVVEADAVDDEAIRVTIRRTFEEDGVVVCPHTACGVEVLRRLRLRGATGPFLVAATAHPAKFESVVEPLIGRVVEVPAPLAQLLARPAVAQPLEPTLQALRGVL